MTGLTDVAFAPATASGGRPGVITDLVDNLAMLNKRADIVRNGLFAICERLGLPAESIAAPAESGKELPGQIAAAQRQVGDLYTTMDEIDHAISVLNRL